MLLLSRVVHRDCTLFSGHATLVFLIKFCYQLQHIVFQHTEVFFLF